MESDRDRDPDFVLGFEDGEDSGFGDAPQVRGLASGAAPPPEPLVCSPPNYARTLRSAEPVRERARGRRHPGRREPVTASAGWQPGGGEDDEGAVPTETHPYCPQCGCHFTQIG